MVFTLKSTQGQCKYLSNTLTQSCVNVLGYLPVCVLYIINDHAFLQIHIN